MSRHTGVSCDACSKGSFVGKRYKCLICYDFDLCADCYDNNAEGSSNGRHDSSHPMQCILTKVDGELHYSGESHATQHPQSFTCPLCGKLGFSESQLHSHVNRQHSLSQGMHQEVICPVCAAQPGSDPNHLTDNFLAHLSMDHRALRDLDWMGDPSSRHVRRLLHSVRGRGRRQVLSYISGGGGAGSNGSSPFSHYTIQQERQQQSQQSQQQQHSPQDSSSGDPIAELLSQLSGPGGRHTEDSSPFNPHPSQIQQLIEQQERFERGSPSRRPFYRKITSNYSSGSSQPQPLPPRDVYRFEHMSQSGSFPATSVDTQPTPQGHDQSPYLLSKCIAPNLSEAEREGQDKVRADRSLFTQQLILSTLCISDESSDSADEKS